MSRVRVHVLTAYLSIAGAITGCVSSASNHGTRGSSGGPYVEAAVRAGMPINDAHAARELYALKCAKCHQFYDPANYDETEWQTWMRKMSKKSRLSSAEEQLLNVYINAYRTLNLERAR
jgi:hypothetical protein